TRTPPAPADAGSPAGSAGARRGGRGPARGRPCASRDPSVRAARSLLGRRGLLLRFGSVVSHEIGYDLDRLVVFFGEAGQTYRFAHLPLDLIAEVDVLREERARVLAPLAELLALIGEPRTGFLDDLQIDAGIEERAFLGDALAVHDVELALPEGGRDLVLHDLDPG